MNIEKELTKRMDDKSNYYMGLAARVSYIVIGVTALIMSGYFVFVGEFDKAFLVMQPVGIGVLLFFALSIKWKIGEKK